MSELKAKKPGSDWYQRMVETMREGAAVLDFEGAVLQSNARFAEILERPLGTVVGSRLTACVHPRSLSTLEALLERGRTQPSSAEIELLTSAGWPIPFLCSVVPHPRETDEAGVIYVVATDLTDLKRNEEIVSADRLAGSILDQAAEAIVVCDREARIIRASQAAHRLVGSNLLFRSFYEAFPFTPPGPSEEKHPLESALLGEVVAGIEVVLPPSSASSADLSLLLSATPLSSAQRQLIGAVVTLTDITDRKRAETERAKLYEAEQMARQRAEEMAERFAELQQISAALADANSAEAVATLAVRLGRSAIRAAIGALYFAEPDGSLTLLADDSDGAFDFEPWKKLAPRADAEADRAGQPRSLRWFDSSKEYVMRWPELATMRVEGSVEALTCVPMVSEGRTVGLVAFAFDRPRTFSGEERAFIQTFADQCAQSLERAWLLDAERSARAEAERANRIKDEFLATMSHELRTPLNAILGWAVTARGKTVDPARIAHALEVIERNARAQSRLIDDLLDVSKIVSGKLPLHFESVALGTVVQSAADVVRPAAEAKGITLEIIGSSEEVSVSGDPDRLQQIVWNLVSNAVKFTQRGGQVTAELGRQGSSAVIRVRDTGSGIAQDHLPYIFERFRQADSSTTRSYGGLGLGLAIVRHLVELHGGTTLAESEGPGRGSTFTIILPIRAIAQAAPSPIAPTVRDVPDVATAPPLPSLQGIRVLVVDDEEDAREIICEVLEMMDAEVRAAASAEEALRLLSELRPDVLVSDIGMPGTDGFALIRKVRSLAPRDGGRTPAIALTAYARVDDARQVVAAGFQVHLAKPIEPAELVTVIASVAGKSTDDLSHSDLPPSGSNLSDTELMQYLSPVGLGPSSKT